MQQPKLVNSNKQARLKERKKNIQRGIGRGGQRKNQKKKKREWPSNLIRAKGDSNKTNQ